MNKINFTNEQIEYIKNASDHVEMLCGGRGQGKTHKLINEMQDKINNLQSKIDKAIDKLESLLPMCIMPNNMLIHGTEKEKIIEETLDILKEDK